MNGATKSVQTSCRRPIDAPGQEILHNRLLPMHRAMGGLVRGHDPIESEVCCNAHARTR